MSTPVICAIEDFFRKSQDAPSSDEWRVKFTTKTVFRDFHKGFHKNRSRKPPLAKGTRTQEALDCATPCASLCVLEQRCRISSHTLTAAPTEVRGRRASGC